MKSEKIDLAYLLVLVIVISYMHALRIEEKNSGIPAKNSREEASKQKPGNPDPRVSVSRFLR